MDGRHASLYLYRFGAAEFNEARFELRVGGLVVEAQQKPLQILALLLATPDEVVTKDRINSVVWDGRPTGDNVLANAVSKLRDALGAAEGTRIVTVPRQGYRLAGPVERSAIGRRLMSRLALAVGTPVPCREHFLLLRQLGSSHASETWLARHARSGAERVYKFALDGERLADLKREATLARLLRASLGERDDLVRILDWNFEAPPYFLESEFGGESLVAWAKAREPAGDDTRLAAMPAAERLALFVSIVDSVAAAHRVAVLHKDLKPANVLVARRADGWRVRLVDFGSGRLLEPERLAALEITGLGLTLAPGGDGTPFYLAPELAGGAAPSMQSDVYALGVMLYQWLAGDLRRPMASGWERTIADPLLAEDIALATDVDPARRLGSAAALADRLRCLEARRDARAAAEAANAAASATQAELMRARARRPWVAATMLALAVGIGIGIGSALWLYAGQRRTAERLAEQLDLVQALNALLRQDVIVAANPAVSGRADVTVADALAAAAAGIDARFGQRSPALRASLYQTMQGALSELSRLNEAVAAGRQALAAYTLAPAVDQAVLQTTRLRLALDLIGLSQLDEARAVARDIERDAGPPERQAQGFRVHWLLVQSWLSTGPNALAESTRHLEAAWALAVPRTLAEERWREKVQFALADNLAMLGRGADAEWQARDLLAAQRREYGTGHLRPCVTLVVLGKALMQEKRRGDAAAVLTEAEAGLRVKLGPGHRMTLDAADLLAQIRFAEHDYERAAADWSAVEHGFTALLGEGSSFTITVQTNKAMARHYAGHPQDAEPLLRVALKRVRRFATDDEAQMQQIRYALADCLLDLGRAGEAEPLLAGLDARTLSDAQQEDDWPARLDSQRGRIALAQGDRSEALALLARAEQGLSDEPAARLVPAVARALIDRLQPQVAAAR